MACLNRRGRVKRFITLCALVSTLVATLGMGGVLAAEPTFSPAQKQAVEKIVRGYISRHPEVLLGAIRALQARQQKQGKANVQAVLAARRGELENDPDTPVGGNPGGNVSVIEFFDYRCGFCKRVFPSMMALIKADGNIRYVLKEFPILGPISVTASRAALAVWKIAPKKYMSFHSELMKVKGGLSDSKIIKAATAIGLNPKELVKAMGADWITAELDKNMQLAKSLNIRGTPAFIIGKRFIPGALSLDSLKLLVKKARQG